MSDEQESGYSTQSDETKSGESGSEYEDCSENNLDGEYYDAQETQNVRKVLEAVSEILGTNHTVDNTDNNSIQNVSLDSFVPAQSDIAVFPSVTVDEIVPNVYKSDNEGLMQVRHNLTLGDSENVSVRSENQSEEDESLESENQSVQSEEDRILEQLLQSLSPHDESSVDTSEGIGDSETVDSVEHCKDLSQSQSMNVLTDDENVVTDGENVVTDGENVVTDGENVVTDGENVVTDGENVVTDGERSETESILNNMEVQNSETFELTEIKEESTDVDEDVSNTENNAQLLADPQVESQPSTSGQEQPLDFNELPLEERMAIQKYAENQMKKIRHYLEKKDESQNTEANSQCTRLAAHGEENSQNIQAFGDVSKVRRSERIKKRQPAEETKKSVPSKTKTKSTTKTSRKSRAVTTTTSRKSTKSSSKKGNAKPKSSTTKRKTSTLRKAAPAKRQKRTTKSKSTRSTKKKSVAVKRPKSTTKKSAVPVKKPKKSPKKSTTSKVTKATPKPKPQNTKRGRAAQTKCTVVKLDLEKAKTE